MNFLEGRYERARGELVLDGGTSFQLPRVVAGRLQGYDEERLVVGVRPEDTSPAPPRAGAECVRLEGRIALEEPLGHETLTHFEVAGRPLVARGSREFTGDGAGAAALYIDAARVHLFSKESGTRVAPAA
jgi:multiple sugar transport system ATP-binding protein